MNTYLLRGTGRCPKKAIQIIVVGRGWMVDLSIMYRSWCAGGVLFFFHVEEVDTLPSKKRSAERGYA
jgi:hypothetical protein